MQLQPTNHGISSGAADEPLIQVTGLYEDLESGVRAKALVECVQAGLELPARFKLDLWQFDWLGEAPVRNISLSTAKSSALVILSTRCASLLPPAVEDWIRVWSQHLIARDSALIVLLPKQRTSRLDNNLLRERLQYAAQQKHADFFCEYFDAPRARREAHREQAHVPRQIAVWSGQSAKRMHFTVPGGRAANRLA